jgi:hypothetical protein
MKLAVLAAFVSGVIAAPAMAGPIAQEKAVSDQAPDKAVTESADEAKPAEEFKVPAGYQVRKRGKRLVYCKKSMESGTRFAQTQCFDEEQLRAKELERQQEQAKMDQTRKVCATPETCAGG